MRRDAELSSSESCGNSDNLSARNTVPKRDEYRCKVPGCTTLKRGKHSVAVHHRGGEQRPGEDTDALLAMSYQGDRHVSTFRTTGQSSCVFSGESNILKV